jgi:S-adenosyl-L-methionine hydrolase (adenosine-forming)
MAPPRIITLTSDFGVQSQGIGIMEGVIASLAPRARVIHLMHGLPDYGLASAARTMENVVFLPVGIHVCVVDPGVGTKRRGIVLKTRRGDYLVGPDNGIFLPALRMLGWSSGVEITNKRYMREPVSPVFHGRDVFAPAAAHLANGAKMRGFGPQLQLGSLAAGPYGEAQAKGGKIEAEVIHVNKYGSVHLNILHAAWDALGVREGDPVRLSRGKRSLLLPFVTTFGDVAVGKPLILKDDYGRVEAAINQGDFAATHGIRIGDRCVLSKH